jgi:hypothetical protein
MNTWQSLDDMAKLFTQIIIGQSSIEEMEEMEEEDLDEAEEDMSSIPELTQAITKHFARLQELHRGGAFFSQLDYVTELRQRIIQAQKEEDEKKAWEYFYDYYELLDAIWTLRNFRELIIKFRNSGLAHWTQLNLDVKTLRFFAVTYIERAEENLALGKVFEPKEAIYIDNISRMYRVDLSLELRAAVRFVLSDLPGEEGYEEQVANTSNLQ